MNEPIGYKVVSYKTRRSISGENSPYGVCYIKGIPTIPKVGSGPLCVFKTKYQAEQFIKQTLFIKKVYTLILRCAYTKSKHLMVWRTNTGYHFHVTVLPKGTILADSVTCLE